jgi:pseudouridine synthase
VRVNGTVVRTVGARVVSGTDRIELDGGYVAPPALAYVLLHKPRGVVSSVKDPQGRVTVRRLLPRALAHLYPVGRLDLNSTGLMLLTNDGDVALRLTHPRYGVPRTYRVKISGRPEARALARVRRGISLDGRRTAPATVQVVERLPTKTWLEVSVTEGRQHLIRRLCEAIGHPVEKLCRVRMGPLVLEGLPRGAYRALSPAEIAELRAGVGLETPRAPGRRLPASGMRRQRRAPPARSRNRPGERTRR